MGGPACNVSTSTSPQHFPVMIHPKLCLTCRLPRRRRKHTSSFPFPGLQGCCCEMAAARAMGSAFATTGVRPSVHLVLSNKTLPTSILAGLSAKSGRVFNKDALKAAALRPVVSAPLPALDAFSWRWGLTPFVNPLRDNSSPMVCRAVRVSFWQTGRRCVPLGSALDAPSGACNPRSQALGSFGTSRPFTGELRMPWLPAVLLVNLTAVGTVLLRCSPRRWEGRSRAQTSALGGASSASQKGAGTSALRTFSAAAGAFLLLRGSRQSALDDPAGPGGAAGSEQSSSRARK